MYLLLLYLFLALLSNKPEIRRIFNLSPIFDFGFMSCLWGWPDQKWCHSTSTSFTLCLCLICDSIARTTINFSSMKGPLSRPMVQGWLSVANYFFLCRLKIRRFGNDEAYNANSNSEVCPLFLYNCAEISEEPGNEKLKPFLANSENHAVPNLQN